METKKKKTSLVISQIPENVEKINNVLKGENYTVLNSGTIDDALLKISNQDFTFISIDMDSIGLQTRDFIASLRKKEVKKNIKEKTHIIVCGSVASVFNRYFTHFDNVKFVEIPIIDSDLSTKVKSFGGKTDVIFDNTRLIPKGEFLIMEGGDGQDMYWILDGAFEILKSNEGEEDRIIGSVNPGELVGEMSFLDDLPRSASIRAITDSEVLVIPQSKFADVLNSQPRWFRSLMKTLSQRLRESNKRLTD